MLPEIRNKEHLFPVPRFTVAKGDVKDFIRERKGFHEVFIGCFHRSESRDHFFLYMVGQSSEVERKSIEPIALNVEDGNVRPMQRFISSKIDLLSEENYVKGLLTIIEKLQGRNAGVERSIST